MTDHDTFTALPARMIRFYGAMAERQIRLMTEMTLMVMRPNPFLLAYAGVELDRPAPKRPPRTRPAPKPRAARLPPQVPGAKPKLVAEMPKPTAAAEPKPAPEPKARPAAAQASKRARRQPSKPPVMPGTPD